MKELICIVCPKGCHLQVDEQNDYQVFGNSCPRGAEYGKNELLHPTRVLTSIVKVTGGNHHCCSVKTNGGIPKEDIEKAMEPLYTTKPEWERSGMGFAFMEAFMDELQVYSEVGKGTRVKLSKRIGNSCENSL